MRDARPTDLCVRVLGFTRQVTSSWRHGIYLQVDLQVDRAQGSLLPGMTGWLRPRVREYRGVLYASGPPEGDWWHETVRLRPRRAVLFLGLW